jgi:hypothetical protein
MNTNFAFECLIFLLQGGALVVPLSTESNRRATDDALDTIMAQVSNPVTYMYVVVFMLFFVV